MKTGRKDLFLLKPDEISEIVSNMTDKEARINLVWALCKIKEAQWTIEQNMKYITFLELFGENVVEELNKNDNQIKTIKTKTTWEKLKNWLGW